MDIVVGINGFGRIGKSFLRLVSSQSSIRVAHINDPFATAEHIAHLIKYDSVLGKFCGSVTVQGDIVILDGKPIRVTQKSDPSSINWSESKVVYVFECSGVFTTLERASTHLAGGAARVVIATISSDAPTFVPGVNETLYKPQNQVVAAGSCTGVVLSLALKVVHDSVGVEEVYFTVIHSATSQQKFTDGTNAKDWRGSRSAGNIVLYASGALKTLAKVHPTLVNKTLGNVFRVPVANCCALDITVKCSNVVQKDVLLAAFARAGLEVCSDEIVSCDASGFIALIDEKSLQVSQNTFKVVIWFDNELGYVKHVVRLLEHMNRMW